MNLLLSDDYLLQDYPEHITNTIRSGHTTCLRFSRRGDLLASGRVDGVVVVWDLETMGVARKLRGHKGAISSLSWSRCGQYLLSACQDWRAVLWDLQDGTRYREVRFRAPIYTADLHPYDQYVIGGWLLLVAVHQNWARRTNRVRLCIVTNSSPPSSTNPQHLST